MKKYFQIIGIISLACFSFMFTEKTALMVRNSDSLMQTIKENEAQYEVKSINASIEGNTIIPGIGGKKVNGSKSYTNMKRLGQFNANLLLYDYILPEVSLTKNYDKYVIGGNPRKNMVSLIIKINSNDKIDEIQVISNNGEIIKSKTFNSNLAKLEFTLKSNKNKFYYIKVIQNNDKISVTSPIWIE